MKEAEINNSADNILKLIFVTIEYIKFVDEGLGLLEKTFKFIKNNAEIAFDLQEVAYPDWSGNEITIEFRSSQTSSLSVIR